MRKSIVIAIASLLVMAFAACDPEAVYNTKKVDLSLDTIYVSAGLCSVHCEVSREAYYLLSIVENDYKGEPIEPQRYRKQFMTLALDSAYMKYVEWRHWLLADAVPYVASFSDHSLQYGHTDYTFQNLRPDTEYWIFAFVVDPVSNTPVGDLVCKKIRTRKTSAFADIRFGYRVKGSWSYIYPYNRNTEDLHTEMPWICAWVDSLSLREVGARVPGEYFDTLFTHMQEAWAGRPDIRYGIQAFEHTPEYYMLHAGVTYYFGASVVDGPRSESFSIYRFTWNGASTSIELVDSSPESTRGAW